MKIKPIRLAGIFDRGNKTHQAGSIYSIEGIAPTLDTCGGGYRMPLIVDRGGKILIKNATKQGYLVGEVGDGVDISSRMQYHRGTVQKGMSLTIKATLDVGVIVSD